MPHQWPKEFGPVILLETMAMGKPVITSGIGAVEEFVKHGRNGFIVDDFRSPAAFAKSIQQILDSPGTALQMGERARESVDDLLGISCTEKLLTLYTSLLGETKH